MNDDEYSDLTDIDSEDYDAQSKKKGPKSKASLTSGYKIKNALKAPRATTYTAQALHQQIHSGEIKTDPEYQRDVVWPETKMVGIIDSIFRNFYIPPIIFAVTSHDDGSETKVCIDGKQRLTSIQKFMDGLISHKDPITNEKLFYTDISTGGSKLSRPKRLLPDKYRRLFANKQVVCVEYQDITEQDEREIFQRVQLGMALTPAEKLQVINTPRASFIRTLQQRFLKESDALSGEHLEWERSRGSDFRVLAQVVFCLDNFAPTLKGAVSIIKLERWLNETTEFPSTFKDGVMKTFELFSKIALDKQLGKCLRNDKFASGKVSPVEVVCIGLLIGICAVGVVGSGPGVEGTKHRHFPLGLDELSVAIGKMREMVRDEHVDIRMNDRVARTMFDFIRGTGGLKRKRGSDEDESNKAPRKGTAPTLAPPSTALPAGGLAQASSMTGKGVVTSPGNMDAKASKPDRLAGVRAAKIQATQVASSAALASMPSVVSGGRQQLPPPAKSRSASRSVTSTPTQPGFTPRYNGGNGSSGANQTQQPWASSSLDASHQHQGTNPGYGGSASMRGRTEERSTQGRPRESSWSQSRGAASTSGWHGGGGVNDNSWGSSRVAVPWESSKPPTGWGGTADGGLGGRS